MSDSVFFNELNYGMYIKSEYGQKNNRGYQNIVKYSNVVYTMTDMIKNPPDIFRDIILTHFYLKKDIIIQTIDKWLIEAEESNINNTAYEGITYS